MFCGSSGKKLNIIKPRARSRSIILVACLLLVQCCALIPVKPVGPPLDPKKITKVLADFEDQERRVNVFFSYGTISVEGYFSEIESDIVIVGIKNPLKIKIEYDDGSLKECGIDELSGEGKKELAALGLIPREAKGAYGGRYVLVEWKGGWKEIYPAPEYATEVRSYFVIRRVEETGRLFLEKEEGYPALIEILRKPQEVEKVTLL